MKGVSSASGDDGAVLGADRRPAALGLDRPVALPATTASRRRSRCSAAPGRSGCAASSVRSAPARTGCRSVNPGARADYTRAPQTGRRPRLDFRPAHGLQITCSARVFRHRHSRVGDVLAQVSELRHALQRRRHGSGRRHDRQGARPGRPRGRRELARHAAGAAPRPHGRGRGGGVRAGRDPAWLLPVSHHARRDASSSRPTPTGSTTCSKATCSAPSSGGCRWPRRSWPASPSACSCAPGNDDQFEVDDDPGGGQAGRADRRPRGRDGRLPDGLDRMVECDALEDLPGGAGGCPARADPRGHGAADQPAASGSS